MRRAFRSLAVACAAGLSAFAPAAAAAQCRLCETPTTGIEAAAETPVALEVEASLDFDRLILTGPDGGTASLSPDGSRSVSGSLAELTGRAMVGSATIRGEPGRFVRIGLPGRIDLYSPSGGRITIEELISDVGGAPRLDSNGRLAFRFGGRLRVSGSADGDYRGEFPITVDYP
jgi:hypothetical protein